MLYTRKGDSGTSGLFGTKKRYRKDTPVYHALGTLDELNSLLGICKAQSAADFLWDAAEEIRKVQESLFVIQAELAGAEKTITQERVEALEYTIGVMENLIENPRGFDIPGATVLSGFLDYARAVSRRAERAVIAAGTTDPVSATSRAYLNRLSTLLYVLARYAARDMKETKPVY